MTIFRVATTAVLALATAGAISTAAAPSASATTYATFYAQGFGSTQSFAISQAEYYATSRASAAGYTSCAVSTTSYQQTPNTWAANATANCSKPDTP
jgi:hypothetical protein